MNDESMKLQSEDPVPYRCGPVRTPDMDTFTRTVKYDGSLDSVFTHRTQPDTIAGTVWRFILDENKTLVVVPYQSPHAPAKAAHCVPQRIESALGGPHTLGDFGFAVAHTARVNGVARPWEYEIHEATLVELQKWKAGRKWPDLDQYDKDRAEANRERVEKWKAAGLADDTTGNKPPKEWLAERKAITREVCLRHKLPHGDESGKYVEPDRMKAVEKERGKLATKQAQIEAKHRKRIEGEKAKRTAEIEAEALAELGRALSAYGAKNPGKAKLKELFNFIREDVCRGNRINPIIRDADLRRVLEKVERLTGTNILESVFLDYSPGMKERVEELAKATAEAEKIEEAEARRRVLERVRFVAVFEDGRCCLVGSVVRCVHDEKDAERFRLVAPSEAARAEIKTRLEARRLESEIQAAAALAMRKEGDMPPIANPDLGNLVTERELQRGLHMNRKQWEAIRDDVRRDCPPEMIPGLKRERWNYRKVSAWMQAGVKTARS